MSDNKVEHKKENISVKEEVKLNTPVDKKINLQSTGTNKATNVNVIAKRKWGFANKFTFFLGGMGLTFSVLYFHFMNYIQKSDEIIKNDIEEIKRMIERDNLLKGTPKVISQIESVKNNIVKNEENKKI
jgi:hypothetical protein